MDHGIGCNKLYVMYRRDQAGSSELVGRDTFFRLIDEDGLKMRQKRRKARTTDSTHGLPTYPNLIVDFIPTAPDQLWVSDITYITLWREGGKCASVLSVADAGCIYRGNRRLEHRPRPEQLEKHNCFNIFEIKVIRSLMLHRKCAIWCVKGTAQEVR